MEQKHEKRVAARRKKHGLNSYVADTSLKDMKAQIKGTDGNAANGSIPPPPPPLQSCNDGTTLTFNHRTKQYKVKRKKRLSLDVPESFPPSKHPWKSKPVITGVNALSMLSETNVVVMLYGVGSE